MSIAETTEPHRSTSPLALRLSFLQQVQTTTHRTLDLLFQGNPAWRARALATIPAPLLTVDPGGYAGLLRAWVRFEAAVGGDETLVDLATRRGALRGLCARYANEVARSPWAVLEIKQIIGVDGLTAEDVLTGERHFIANGDAARCAEPRRLILARPVRMEGTSLLEGRSDLSLPRSARDAFRHEVARRMCTEVSPGMPVLCTSATIMREAFVTVLRSREITRVR